MSQLELIARNQAELLRLKNEYAKLMQERQVISAQVKENVKDNRLLRIESYHLTKQVLKTLIETDRLTHKLGLTRIKQDS
jgi:regulator of replication initiation timing